MDFDKLYRLVNESPDLCAGLPWSHSDYAFFYCDGLFLKGFTRHTRTMAAHYRIIVALIEDVNNNPNLYYKEENGQMIFHALNNLRRRVSFEYDGLKMDIEFEVNGNIEFLSKIKKVTNREELIKAGVLVGRYWAKENLVSFWNNIDDVELETIMRLAKPENMSIIKFCLLEFSQRGTKELLDKGEHIKNIRHYDGLGNYWGSYDQIVRFLKNKPERNSTDDEKIKYSRTGDLDMVHLMNPVEKGAKMKEMGIKPKTPIPLKDRMRREGD